MKSQLVGPLLVHTAGGTDGQGAGDGPSVLLCHGFGASGEDLVSLNRVVTAPSGTRWFFPVAPLSVDTGMPGNPGRAWWHIDMARLQLAMMRGEVRNLAGETPEGLSHAANLLTQTISALVEHHNVKVEKLVIGGFSQGAMLTTELALMQDLPIAGLVALSGTLLSKDRWDTGAVSRAERLQVFQSHGTHDTILPYDNAEALRDLLATHGAAVQFVPFRGQHEIPAPVVTRLGHFLTDQLKPSA